MIKHNKEIFDKFLSNLSGKTESKASIETAYNNVRYFIDWYEKGKDRSILKIARRDVYEYVEYLNNYKDKDGNPKTLSQHTVIVRKRQLNKFLHWLVNDYCRIYEKDIQLSLPDVESDLRHKQPPLTSPKKDEMITKEEMERMIAACKNSRDRAIIAIFWHLGCRRGELLNLKIGNIAITKDLARIDLTGKTGKRTCFDFPSRYYLIELLKDHPLKDNPEAPLFSSEREPDRHLSTTGLQDILRDICERAGIEKRVYNHLFRHSAGTRLSRTLTDQELKHHFGWSQSSRMASVYVHLNAEDSESIAYKIQGLAPPEKIEDPHLLIQCPRCGTKIPSNVDYCTCMHPISAKAIAAVEKEKAEEAQILELEIDERVKIHTHELAVEFENKLNAAMKAMGIPNFFDQSVKVDTTKKYPKWSEDEKE